MLSKKQSEVVDLMNNGWELGSDISVDSRSWIQQGGLGHGGKSLEVRVTTVWALQDKGVIQIVSEQFPLRRYALVQKGASHEQPQDGTHKP